MRLTIPITRDTTTPFREVVVFAGLTIALSWLFWVPGAYLQGSSRSTFSDLLLAIGSFVPLAVAIFLEIWLRQSTLSPMNWFKTLSVANILLALLLPIIILLPVFMLRFYQSTLNVGQLLIDFVSMGLSIIGIFILSLAEEIGWRAYLLPRLGAIPVFVVNFFVGLLWFLWQLPIILAGRYNESESFNGYLLAMFLFALLVTSFLNRLALRARYNPILPALMRAGLTIITAIYFAQGRADPLTDTFGLLTIAWLFILNILLFSQLWQGKKPPHQITELERVMPLEVN
ncbi:MAG TPA: hypothetical protein VFD70_17440 [Anaerolineae bacterium]|nr:hypothetical protein [Anaerolineae bacterium]